LLRKLLALSIVVAALGGGAATSTATAGGFPANNAWIKKWDRLDQTIWTANREAAKTFRVSERLLDGIVGAEGGNINPRTLRANLCSGRQPGWNLAGSSAFGPFQFMLSYRGACFNAHAWGTFGSYDDAAFKDAKRRGNPVPYRFKHPASNVGQAVTAAYMLANGGLSHWCASQC
jgi:hypothetical protein